MPTGNAGIAGHFNVPVIMISGDDAIVKEAQSILGNIEGAVVKWAYGFHAARTLVPEAAYDLIRDKVKKAIGRLKEFRPYKPASPLQLDVRAVHAARHAGSRALSELCDEL